MPELNDLETWLDEQEKPEVKIDPLAVSRSPDDAASERAIADEVGAIPQAVRAYPELFARRAEAARTERALQGSPRLAQWLNDPSNLEIARDDVQALSEIERPDPWLRFMSDIATSAVGDPQRQFDRIVNSGVTAGANPDQFWQGQRDVELGQLNFRAQQAARGRGEALSIEEEARREELANRPGQEDWGPFIIGPTARLLPQVLGSFERAGADAAASAGEAWEDVYGNSARQRETARRVLNGDVGEGMRATLLAPVAIIGSGLAGAGNAYGGFIAFGNEQETGHAFDQMVRLGVSPDIAAERAEQYGLWASGIEFATSVTGLKLTGVGSLATRTLLWEKIIRGGATQAATRFGGALAGGALNEGVEESAQALAEIIHRDLAQQNNAGQEGDVTAAWRAAFTPEAIKEILLSGYIGAQAGVGMGSVPAGVNLALDMRAVSEAEQGAVRFEQLTRAAQRSLLAQRSPAAFESAVAAMDDSEAHIDADQWVEFFQTQGADPYAVAAELGIPAEVLAQSLASHGLVSMPLSKLTARVLRVPALAGLADHVRATPTAATAAEARMEAEVFDAKMERIVAETATIREQSDLVDAIETKLSALFSRAEREGGPIASVTRRYGRLVSALPQTMMARWRQAQARGGTTKEIADGIETYFRDFFERNLDVQGPERAGAETGRAQFESGGASSFSPEYLAARAQRDAIQAEVDQAAATLRPLSGGGAMGLTPDAMRATPEWQAARRAYDAAFARLRQFNTTFTKQFAREIREDSRARRAAGGQGELNSDPPESGQNSGNGVGRGNGKKPDPIESPDYQERLRAVRDGGSGRDGVLPSEASRGAGSFRGGLGAVRDLIGVSGVHLSTKPKVAGQIGAYRAVIDRPMDATPEVDAVLSAPMGEKTGPTLIDFDWFDGSNPKETRLPGLHLAYTSVNNALKGKGVGTWFYRQLIDWADRQGLPTYSDAIVSDKAAAVYARLEEIGYRVEKISRTRRDGDSIVSLTGGPIFRVTPRGDEAAYDAAPLPRDDYTFDGPTLRQRIEEAAAPPGEFSQGGNAFYSAVEQVVSANTTARASGSQWWATISKAAGVKREELEWMGLEDFLKAREGQISREDVLAFVQANGVRVEETVLGDSEAPSAALQRELLPLIEEQERLFQEISDASNLIVEGGPGYDAALQRRRVADERAREIGPQIIDLRRRISDMAGETSTKWSQYTLPGGSNYRELLLRLPQPDSNTLPQGFRAIRNTNPQRKPDAEWIVIDEPHSRYAHGATEAAAIADYHAKHGAGFRTSHFDQPNILAHVRFNERVDADGKRTLFIEELQSDWHQAGREGGYKGDRNDMDAWRAIERQTPTGPYYEIVDGRGEFVTNVSYARDDRPLTPETALEDARLRWDNQPERTSRANMVPDAPFKNNAWASLALKRMIRFAAEQGMDQIAWTRGQHQIERFNLGREMNRIYFNPETREFTALARGGGAHKESNVTDARLVELLGKEGAKQVLEAPRNRDGEHEIAAGDITVGGEGMRAFYDKIMVNIANDLGKKFGARVGETMIDASRSVDQIMAEGGEYRSDMDTPNPQIFHSLPITPEMREAAMEGQALFARDKGGRPIGGMSPQFDGTKLREAVIRLYAYKDGRSYTLSTFLHETGHLFLELMRTVAADEQAPAEVAQIWDDALNWFGLTREQWDAMDLDAKRPYHERWAEAFEAYLMEGKAPSLSLREAFQAFKAWLKRIYNEMFARERLDPQIRDVFDRMLATDQEIAEARAEMGADFSFGREAFNSDEEFAAYQQSIQNAFQAAEDDLRTQVMDTHVRRGKRRWRALAREQRAAAERTVDADRTRRAYEWLAFQNWRDLPETILSDDGEISYTALSTAIEDRPEGLPEMRLNANALEAEYGAEIFGQLPRGLMPFRGDGALREVLGRLDALAADVPKNQIERANVRVAFPKDDSANAVSARMASEDGEITTAWGAKLHYRAGRDMIVGEAQNDARPVRADIFEATYRQTEDGSWVKRSDVPLGFVVASRNQTIQTLEGPVEAKKGDHILIGAIGEMWPVKPEKFAQRYDAPESSLEAALNEAMRLKREGKVRQPQRLAAFIKAQGGIKDEGGEIKQALGSGRAYPGLINNASGRNADDLALNAWEAGYFGAVPRKGELFSARTPDAGGRGERGSEAFWDERLTVSENKALEMRRNGFSNSEIAEEMDIDQSVVRTFLSNARRRGADVPPASRATPVRDEVVRLSRRQADGRLLSDEQIAERLRGAGLSGVTANSVRVHRNFARNAGADIPIRANDTTRARGGELFSMGDSPDGGAASAGRAADAPNDGQAHPGFEFFSEGPKRPTVQEFIDLLIADLKNERQVYSIRDEAAAADWQNRADAIRWFEARGVDLSGKKDEIAQQIEIALAKEAEGGVDPDTAADWFGFSSGDELIQALKGLKPRAEAIEEEVSRRVEAEIGDPMRDGTLEEEARRAAHSEAQARRIELELMAIQQATGGKKTPVSRAVRARVERIVNAMSVKEARGHDRFLAAERRSARNALEATQKQDWLTAETWKMRQLHSFWMWKLARDAAEEMDKAQRYFRKFERGGVRAAFLPSGAAHLDQIDQVLEAIDLRVNPYPSQRQRQNFQAYLASLQDQGIDADDIVEASPEFLAAINRKPFASLSIEDARGVRSVIENFENLGRRWNRVMTDRKNRQLSDVIDGMVARAQAEYPKRAMAMPSLSSRSRFEQAADLVMDLHGSMAKAEQLFRVMDGLKANGPWFSTFIPAAQRAESAKIERLVSETERFKQLLSAYSRRELGRMLMKKLHVAQIGDSLTKMQMIGVALNSGNDYNRTAVMAGFEWNEQQLQTVLDNLDARDWRFVQGVWDFLDSFKAESFDLDYRVRGVRPEEVKPTPINTPAGLLRGGYFPVKFDPMRSQRAAKRAAKEAVEQLSGGSYRQIGTKRGRLKQRVGTAGQPLRLDPIQIIGEHIEETVHDLTHREFVIDARRMVASGRIRSAVRGVLGPWAVKALDAWVAKIEQPTPQIMSSWERLAGRIKNNATIVNMGLKVTTALIQELGTFNVIPRTGLIPLLKQKGITIARDYPEFVGRQVARLFGAPETLPARVQFIFDRSRFMKHRMETFDRDVKDALATRIGARPGILPQVPKAVQDKMMILSQLMDMAVSVPAWLAGYESALAGKVEGIAQGDEQAAIEHGDSIIRTTQSGGAAKDLAQILASDNQYWRLATMFMSWANTFYNQMFVEQIPGVLAGKVSPPRFAANMLFIWFLPAVATMAFYGRLEPQDGEDEEEFLKRAALEGLIYPLQTVPIMRDGINAYVTGYDYQFTPAQAAMEAPIRLARAAERGNDREVVKQALMTAGYLRGLPSRQMWITGEGITDIATGEDDLSDPLDTVSEVLVRDTR